MRVLHIVVRRHLNHCRDKSKGPFWPKCLCPKWVDGMLGKKRVRRSLDTADWNEAERKVVQMERAGGIWEDKQLSEAVADWEASWRVAESTKRKYRQVMRALVSWAAREGIELVEDLTLVALDKFYTVRKVSQRTKVREIQALRTFFRFCMERKWCVANPATNIRPPRGLKPNEIVPYTRREIATMLAACDRLENYNPEQKEYIRRRAKAMILLLWQTGLRIGDAYRLRRDAIKNGILTIHTQKTSHPIVRRLSPELLEALEWLPRPHMDESNGAYFFWTGKVSEVSKDGGQRRMVIHAIRMLRPIFREAGIKRAHAHRFRHTLATQMLAHGATMPEVALALGNTVAVCERVYAKYDEKRQARVDDLIEKAQGRGLYMEREEILSRKFLKENADVMAERGGFGGFTESTASEINRLTAKEKRKQ